MRELGILRIISLVLFFVCLIFFYDSLSSLNKFYSLDRKEALEKIDWRVVERWGRYRLEANYSYFFESKRFYAKFLDEQRYLNSWAAEQAKKEKSSIQSVWVNSLNASQSALSPYFPLKELVYSFLLLGLLLYFCTLQFFLRGRLQI